MTKVTGLSLQQPPFIKLWKQSLHLPAWRGASGPFTRPTGGGSTREKTGMCFLILCRVRHLTSFVQKSQFSEAKAVLVFLSVSHFFSPPPLILEPAGFAPALCHFICW